MSSGIRQTQEDRTLCHIYVGSLKKSISQKLRNYDCYKGLVSMKAGKEEYRLMMNPGKR